MDRYWFKVGEIFMIIPEKPFAGFSVMPVADLFELPPLEGKLLFSKFSNKDGMKLVLGLLLWYLFKQAKLTEAVRQNCKELIELVTLMTM